MYVDAKHDIKNGVMLVAERVNGERILQRFPVELFFYYEDAGGPYISTTGVKCSKFTTNFFDTYKEEIESMARLGRKIFESDVKPVFKVLETRYKNNAALPNLNIAYFDIETDFDPERGFSSPDEAFMPITAISVEQSWTKKLLTFVIKPQLMAKEDAQAIVEKFENTFLCDSESQLLDMFLNSIEDADILSGWNSGSFDIPYIIHRITKVRGKKDTSRLCLWKQYPKPRTFIRYGNEVKSYDLMGRLHLDYLDLYRKYTYHELPSYRLDYVGEIEVKENKVPYEGTLFELYNKDFEKFVAYSRQDVRILAKLDAKLRYINLVNFVAHENLVTIPTVMGSVALSDNAILLETHKRNMVAPSIVNTYGSPEPEYTVKIGDDEDEEEDDRIAGAFVKEPVPGMYEWIASVDIASLYPSTFRALNMSPETLIGHIDQDLMSKLITERQSRSKKKLNNAEIWAGIFEIPEVTEIQKKSDVKLKLRYESGDSQDLTAKQIWDKIVKNDWLLTANGVIFRTDIEGVVPSLLSTWYKERKDYQKRLAEAKKKREFAETPEEIQKADDEVEYWDKMQLVRKIMLNSVYGALTNPGSKYYDQRMGQSCTLTGRCIARHMGYKINEILMGTYEFGDAIVYGDTDSIYFSPSPIKDVLEQGGFEINKDSFVELANSITDEVNASFKGFLHEQFNVPLQRGEVIKCGREICATRGLFIKKKRYACLYYDKDGKREDAEKTGKVKIMGIETQRSDTPVWVQEKLKEMIYLTLDKNSEEETIEFISKMRKEFEELPAWKKGTPKRVNNLTHYNTVFLSGGKNDQGKTVTVPGHVRAAINWNRIRDAHNDYDSTQIMDGQKVIVCKLRPNNYGITSMAYPIDQHNLPTWFTDLPFDNSTMIEAIIDKKVANIIGVLNWDLSKSKENEVMKSMFSWG